jgi:hypothetical protein
MICSFHNDPLFDFYLEKYKAHWAQIIDTNPRFKNLKIESGTIIFRRFLSDDFNNKYHGEQAYIMRMAVNIQTIIESYTDLSLSQVIQFAKEDLKSMCNNEYEIAQTLTDEALIDGIAHFDVLVTLLKPEIHNEFNVYYIQESGIEYCAPLPILSEDELKVVEKLGNKFLKKEKTPNIQTKKEESKKNEESYPLDRTFRKTPKIWDQDYLEELKKLQKLLIEKKLIVNISFLEVESHLVKGKVSGDRINWLGDIDELVYLMDGLCEYLEDKCHVNNSIKPFFAHHFLLKNQKIIKEQTIYDARKRYINLKENYPLENKLKKIDTIIQSVKST